MKSDICHNMDKPWKHSTKRNKLDTQKNFVWFQLYEISGIDMLIEIESKDYEGLGRGNWGVIS